jgi:hypothetical protein
LQEQEKRGDELELALLNYANALDTRFDSASAFKNGPKPSDVNQGVPLGKLDLPETAKVGNAKGGIPKGGSSKSSSTQDGGPSKGNNPNGGKPKTGTPKGDSAKGGQKR